MKSGWVAAVVLYNLLMVLVWQWAGFGWPALLIGVLIEIICGLVVLIYSMAPRWPG